MVLQCRGHEIAEEHECFDSPYAFASDHARFLFYRDQLSSLHYTPHEHSRCTVTLMSGLPGAGKDTWLAKHRPTLPVVALDAIRDALDIVATDNQGEVIQTARAQCREHLRAALRRFMVRSRPDFRLAFSELWRGRGGSSFKRAVPVSERDCARRVSRSGLALGGARTVPNPLTGRTLLRLVCYKPRSDGAHCSRPAEAPSGGG